MLSLRPPAEIEPPGENDHEINSNDPTELNDYTLLYHDEGYDPEGPSPKDTSTETTPHDQRAKTAAPGLTPLRCGPTEYSPILNDIWPFSNPHAWGSENAPFKLIYDSVRSHALPNYLGAKIPVPSSLNHEAWEYNLQDYHDREICNFLKYGWPISYTANQPPLPTMKNHAFNAEDLVAIDEFIEKEIRLHGMLGPFDQPPFSPWTQVSPLMTRPKKDSHERRVIVDLSYPPGFGVNAGIPSHFFQGEERDYSLPSIGDLITKVKGGGRGCLIWKADLSRAYRQLRTDPMDTPLLAIYHRGSYYLDLCPPFGCKPSGSFCQRTTNAVVFMMGIKGHHALAYVDDFCGAAADGNKAQQAYNDFQTLANELGLTLAPDKCSPPSTEMDWLGFTVNTEIMSVTIPPDKLKETIEECNNWMHITRAHKRRVQSLVGKLVHISKCVLPGRKFLCRILMALRGTPDNGYTNISSEFRADVMWFRLYAELSNGVSLIDPPPMEFTIECDSCLLGGGGHSSKHFYAMPYDKEHTDSFSHISQLEAVNLLIAYRTLTPDMPGMSVLILTDNLSSRHALMSGHTKDPILAACAREMWLEAAKRDQRIQIDHKPGKEMVLADALSRYYSSPRKKELAEQLVKQHCLAEKKPNLNHEMFAKWL